MKIAISGGDMRMVYAAEFFENAGFDCFAFGLGDKIPKNSGIYVSDSLEATLENASAVVLPLPFEKDGFLNMPFEKAKITTQDIFKFNDSKRLFLGGKMKETSECVIDYSEREDFQLKNAVPTAEGAVAIAMKELDITISGANVCIVGFGRIGSYLGKALKQLGANVRIVSRSSVSRTRGEIAGFKTVGFDRFEAPLMDSDIVFNTVPFKVFGEKELRLLPTGTPIIDLASLPGGADEEECSVFGIKLIRALSLPAKVAPKTAGKIVFETVCAILSEKGVTL